jgi:hypothetical protein
VVRGEGIWWFEGDIYFSATSNGQIFRYEPLTASSGTLTLLTASLDAPDNITVAPWGDIFVAEDNGSNNHMRIVDDAGNVADFGRNVINPGDEFAGVCFSPDARALFVNMQGTGYTLVITGPFPSADPGGSGGSSSGGSSSGGSSSGGASSGGSSAGGTSSGGTSTGGETGSGGNKGKGKGNGGGPTAACSSMERLF